MLGLQSLRFTSAFNRMFTDLNRFCDELRREFAFPEGTGLTFAVLDRGTVSAAAYWHSETKSYVIAFDLGFCVWAYEMASIAARLEADEASTDDTRDFDLTAYTETADMQALQARIDLADKHLETANQGYALFVLFNLLISVMTHELAHILRGHVDFVRRSGDQSGRVDELGVARRRTSRHAIPLRVLELDADYIGAGLLSNLAQRVPTPFEFWSRTGPNENLAFALWAFAMFALALEEQDKALGMSDPDYPSPLLRFVLLGTDVIKATGGAAAETSHLILGQVFSMLELYEPLFPSIGLMRAFTEEAWMAQLIDEVDALLEEHKTHVTKLSGLVIPSRSDKA